MRKLSAFAVLTLAASVAYGSQWNKLTRLDVDEPIRVPGAVLQPGEYVVKLADSQSNRHIVRFMNADQTKVISTVLAIPNQRLEPTGQTELGFYETPAGEPVALRSWFYPGDNFGQEFVYPESEAREIAGKSKHYVPTISDEAGKMYTKSTGSGDDDPDAAFSSTEIYAWSPENERAEWKAGSAANIEMDAKAQNRSTKQYARFRQEQQTATRAGQGQSATRGRADERALSSIAREVRHELVMLPYYGVFDHFEFQVDGNTVTLMGKVTRPTLKSSAERVVENIEGVENVVNKIEVLPVSPNDDRIRQAAYRAIYGHTALNRYALQAVPPIHIIVDNGRLTLEGVVANEADKNIANIQAKSVPGVFEVTNNLRVEDQQG